MNDYGTAEVCVDCYFSHHYGMNEHAGEWFAGESDTAADRKPLALLEGFELADNTDSNTGEGIDEFSWRSCEGCGSTLGGARYRLALFPRAKQCFCPDDCGCRKPWRANLCGCSAHPTELA